MNETTTSSHTDISVTNSFWDTVSSRSVLEDNLSTETTYRGVVSNSTMPINSNNLTTNWLRFENFSAYLNDTTDSTSDVVSGSAGGVSFEVPLLVTICVVGLFGNVIVLMVYSHRYLRRTNASLYISNLAVGDILALIVVAFHVTEFFKETWPLLWKSDWSCIILRYLRFVGFNITISTMVAIAIDRYFAICYPMKFKLSFSVRRTKVVIMVLWVIAIIAAIPTGFMFRAIYQSVGSGVTYAGKSAFACKLVMPFGDWFKDFKAIYLNIILFYLPVLITAVAYTLIIHRVWRSTRQMNGRITSQAYKHVHWKTARILFTVFIAYAASYALLSTYNLVSRYFPSYHMHPMVKNVGLLLPYVNSCMNPIIYSFLDGKFRSACWALFCCKKKRIVRSDETQTVRVRISSIRNHSGELVVPGVDLNGGTVNPALDVGIQVEEQDTVLS
ncbi:nociceptin receptor-like [Ptychodera flava]|uniref:nociceptin receptor-like n=1 Tax=Ptychodera flava TaxID=63121 RepID=UPI00396A5331